MSKRFRRLRGTIREAVVDKDVFGLAKKIQDNQTPRSQAFDFPTTQAKVSEFMEWLQDQVDSGILEVSNSRRMGQSIDQAWQNLYIKDTYKRGVIRSTYEMNRLGFPDVSSIEEQGGIQAVLSQPAHLDRLGALYTRAYTELKGVTDDMGKRISQILTQGLADGDGPRLLARKLTASIGGRGATPGQLGLTDSLGRFIPAQRRAEMLARTETIRAHHKGMMQTYNNWGVEGVKVKAEFTTAGDSRVCPICQNLEGTVFTLKKAEHLIPVHPNCRCIVLPILPENVQNPDNDPTLDSLDSKHHSQYLSDKKKYKEWLATKDPDKLKLIAAGDDANLERLAIDLAQDIKEFAEQEFPNMARALSQWQSKPGGELATRMRQFAMSSEEGVGNVLSWQGAEQVEDLLSLANAQALKMSEYVRVRAFNQAFMELMDIKKMKVFRGIGGPSGGRLKDALTGSGMRRTKISLDDTTLSGWSSDIGIAKEFGENGIWVKYEVGRESVFIHHGLLNSITKEIGAPGWAFEMENILLGGKRFFNFNQLDWY